MSTELTLPPVRPTRNRINGQYLKGHEPANKGKEWDEWMSKKGQRRAAKGWKNLEDHRIANGQKYGGRNRKTVIALTDDGKFRVFDNIRYVSNKVNRVLDEQNQSTFLTVSNGTTAQTQKAMAKDLNTVNST